MRLRDRWATLPATLMVAGALAVLLAFFATIGADLMWAVAMGRLMLDSGRILHDLPFAEADQAWHNVPAVGEVILGSAYAAGPRGIVLLHVACAASSWLVLGAAARRRGATDAAAAITLLVLAAATLPVWGVARLQTLSFAPFALLVLVLVTESARPTPRIWLAPILVMVWGNLHGAVLLGVCVLGAYLVGQRLWQTPRTAVGVGVLSLLALGVNPALGHTPAYYLGVFRNEAAASREHLWAPLRLDSGLDIALAVGILALVGVALWRGRPQLWELIAVGGLLLATMLAARNGVWLLLVVAPVAARGVARVAPASWAQVPRRQGLLAGSVGLALLAGSMALVSTGSRPLSPVDPGLVRAVVGVAEGRVVLAPEPLVETLMVAGVRVWAGDPIDAFPAEDQRAYLAFLAGSGDWSRAVRGSTLIVVPVEHPLAGSPPAGFRPVQSGDLPPGWRLLAR